MDKQSEIQKFEDMMNAGTITPEEFEAEKAKILASPDGYDAQPSPYAPPPLSPPPSPSPYYAQNSNNQPASKTVHVPSLVLMIVGGVFCLLFPLITYPCSIISLVMSVKKKDEFNTTYAIVINIIVLAIAAINSIVGVIIALSAINEFF
jgi:hypothetical protein